MESLCLTSECHVQVGTVALLVFDCVLLHGRRRRAAEWICLEGRGGDAARVEAEWKLMPISV
eukprot:1337966-Rhodomonas_salina.1